jgi:hypothetical protein
MGYTPRDARDFVEWLAQKGYRLPEKRSHRKPVVRLRWLIMIAFRQMGFTVADVARLMHTHPPDVRYALKHAPEELYDLARQMVEEWRRERWASRS